MPDCVAEGGRFEPSGPFESRLCRDFEGIYPSPEITSAHVRAERRLDLDLRPLGPVGIKANPRSRFLIPMSFATSYSNDLECASLFDELLQPVHVRCAARPARIVGPAVDVLLRPAVVNRA